MYITDIQAKDGRKSAIFKFNKVDILRVYPSPKPHNSYYSNDLAIWHGFPNIILPDIRHIKISNGR